MNKQKIKRIIFYLFLISLIVGLMLVLTDNTCYMKSIEKKHIEITEENKKNVEKDENYLKY